MAEAKKATSKTKKVSKTTEPVIDETVNVAAAEAAVAEAKPETIAEEAQEISEEVEEVSEATEKTPKGTAKAGKRSAKAVKEAEELEAKEARKEAKAESDEQDKPKKIIKPTRSRLERRGKLFRKSAEHLEKDKAYKLEEAVDLAKKTSHVKFDATVELHVNLNVDPRHADQNIRDNVLLPAGSGKKVRVAVLTDDADGAKKAGADIAGNEELLTQLEKGTFNFDILIATPVLMSKLGKYARTLGPRGLMPNPKSGTVTTDVNRAIAEAKAGRVEYRVDSTGIVHLGVGKVSFTPVQLLDNLQAVMASIKSNKPASVKGVYLKSAHLTTTMGPSIALDLASLN
jgi:large subunit ribosomal protein L1